MGLPEQTFHFKERLFLEGRLQNLIHVCILTTLKNYMDKDGNLSFTILRHTGLETINLQYLL